MVLAMTAVSIRVTSETQSAIPVESHCSPLEVPSPRPPHFCALQPN